MTSHLNIDWEGTRYLNDREYNTDVRWAMKHDPNGHMNRNVYSQIKKRSDGTETAGGFGRGGRYESDPLVSVPVAMRKDLHRKEVTMAMNERAKEQERMRRSGGGGASSNTNNLPTITSPSRLSQQQQQNEDEEADGDGQQQLGTTGGSTADLGGGDGRYHVRRKHKKNCPKHLLNEMRRRKEAEAAGIAPLPYSEVLDGKDAIPCTVGLSRKEILHTESNVDKLIKETPFMVGRSMAYVFTGSYDPSVNVREHRMVTEHPNFAKNNAKSDRLVKRSEAVTADRKMRTAKLYSTGGNGSGAIAGEEFMGTCGSLSKAFNTTAATDRSSSTTINRTANGERLWGSTRPSALQQQLTRASGDASIVNTYTPNGGPSEDEQLMMANTQRLLDANTKAAAAAASTRKGHKPLPTDGPHRHLEHVKVAEEKVLVDDIKFDHYRRKYEMKTHMEKMRAMGPALLREFASKGFK